MGALWQRRGVGGRGHHQKAELRAEPVGRGHTDEHHKQSSVPLEIGGAPLVRVVENVSFGARDDSIRK